MSLQRNYIYDSRTSGFPLRFVYLASSGRLQAYLGRTSPQTGQFDPESEYLDEKAVHVETRAEARQLAQKFETSGTTPDKMEF